MGRTAESVRIGRVIYNDGLDIVKDAKVEELIGMILEGSSVKTVEVWLSMDNPAETFGCQVFEDGMYLTAFFDRKTGNLQDDWF